MEKHKITVVMTTYNGERYIREQLESLELQERLPDEIIISDDNSTDDSWRIIEEWKKSTKVKTVKLFKNPNISGCNSNFTFAISKSTGDLVFLCDQDDYWYKNKISITESYLSSSSALVCVHDLMYCDDNLKETGVKKIDRIRELFKQDVLKYHVTGMATAGDGDFIRSIAKANIALYAYDNWINDLSYYLNAKSIINVVLASYRRHSSNVTVYSVLNSNVSASRFSTFINKIKSMSVFDYDAYIDSRYQIRSYIEENRLMLETEILDFDFDTSLSKINDELELFKIRKSINNNGFICFLKLSFILFANKKFKDEFRLKHLLRDFWFK